jgi:alkanesulfonate monooxygenase SsuD/methylene tetrahydromethanopterin reductase-like flavin-dependent oxidoreductase (luciferase family)
MIFSIAWNQADAKQFKADIESRVAQLDDNAAGPLVLPGLSVYVADTLAEAEQKVAALNVYTDIEKKIQQIEQSIGQDTTEWHLDDPVPQLPPYESLTVKVGSKARYQAIQRAVEVERLTFRDLIARVDTWMGHKTIVGDPIMVADMMQTWFESGSCDGFILMPPTYPDMFEAFIDKVIPILQERGLFRTEYTEQTLRERIKREVTSH